jgi:hypothetical protein
MRRARVSVGQLLVLIAAIAIEFGVFIEPAAICAGVVTIVGFAVAVLVSLRAGVAVGGVMGLLLMPHFGERKWIGSKTLPVRFLVTEEATGRPIAGARIRLYGPERSIGGEGRTAEDGRGEVLNTFRASIEMTAFGERGDVGFEGWWLEVSADGYQSRFVTLTESTGLDRRLPDHVPPPIAMGLARPESHGEGPLADLAGEYFWVDGTGGWTLKIEADGRYSLVSRWSLRTASAGGGRVLFFRGHLLFTDVHPSPFLPQELVPFRWGERLYLLDPNDWERRIGAEPRSGPFGEAFLRVGDWNRMAGSPSELPGGPLEGTGGGAAGNAPGTR